MIIFPSASYLLSVGCLLQTLGSFKTDGGTEVQEVEIGSGKLAKPGKKVSRWGVQSLIVPSFPGLCQVHWKTGTQQQYL